jgi:hypothetical protein
MFDKYVKVNEKKIVAGQTSSGVWYCKEAVAETTSELRVLLGEINLILNEYNSAHKEDVVKKEKKEKKTIEPIVPG